MEVARRHSAHSRTPFHDPRHPFELQGREVFVTASIGIAVAEDRSTGGGSSCQSCTWTILPTGPKSAVCDLKRGLRRGAAGYHCDGARDRDNAAPGLAEGQLDLHYQPIVDLARPARPSGSAGLLPWQHPQREACSDRISSSPRRGVPRSHRSDPGCRVVERAGVCGAEHDRRHAHACAGVNLSQRARPSPTSSSGSARRPFARRGRRPG